MVTVNVKYHGNERNPWMPLTVIRTVWTRYTHTVYRSERLAAPTPPAPHPRTKGTFQWDRRVSNPPALPKPRRPLITFTFRIAWLKNGALIRCSFEPLMDFHIESALIRIKTN